MNDNITLTRFDTLNFEEKFKIIYAWFGTEGIARIYFKLDKISSIKIGKSRKLTNHIIKKYGKYNVYLYLYKIAKSDVKNTNNFCEFIKYCKCWN